MGTRGGETQDTENTGLTKVEYVTNKSTLNHGFDLIGWWTIIPLTYYMDPIQKIANGHNSHLQFPVCECFKSLMGNHPTKIL